MNSEDPNLWQDITGAEPGSQSGKGAGQVVNEVLNYSREVGRSLLAEIKSESSSIAGEQLNLASRKLDAFAEVLQEAAEKLREKQSNSLADIVEIGSRGSMRLSKSLKESDPENIIDEVEDFARRQPEIFLGAAVVAGILLGQLFSSPGGRKDTAQEFHPRRESSIEYRPGKDEEGYHERH